MADHFKCNFSNTLTKLITRYSVVTVDITMVKFIVMDVCTAVVAFMANVKLGQG